MSSRRPIYFNPTAAGQRCQFSPIEGLDQFHRSLPKYSQSPLVSLPDLAAKLGVRAIFVKDESNRFGLPSFKVLGASWGCYRALASNLELPLTASLNDLSVKAKERSITLIAATKGNHGRAVAFMARLLGITAKVFVPDAMDEGTRRLIAAEGASLVIVKGDYDQAVQEASRATRATDGALLIQDTPLEGYTDIPSWIVEGYSTMFFEIEEQLGSLGLSSSLMVTPVGVGSLAQAVVRYCKSRETPVSVLAVEPDSAPCLHTSLTAGRSVTVQSSSTIMDGMNCETVSSTGWPELQQSTDACITVSSYESHRAVQYLSSHSVAAGPCGGASLAALWHLAESDKAASLLNKDSVVVLLSTEGARDYMTPWDVSMDDGVGLTQALVRINSSNPTLSMADGAGEGQISNYLEAWFAHRDIEYHRIEPVTGRPSVVGVLRGSGGGQSLMFNGHVDTVSLSSYERDPLSGSLGEKDGKQVILGRGSLDMKGGLAAALAAVSATKAAGHVLKGDVILAAVSDEEDSSQGTRDLLDAGWRADVAIIPEPTSSTVFIAHKGFVWVELDILGVAAHGSRPDEGEDAILLAARFLQSLERYQQQLPVDETLGQASLHCGLIRGGEEPSSYPAKCTITVEFRTVSAQSEESILSDLDAMLRGISQEDPRFRYTAPRVTLSRPAQKLDPNDPFVKRMVACSSTVLGRHLPVQSGAFWCDAALLGEAGIPAVVFGPDGAGLHSKEEWVEVNSLNEMEEVYTELIHEFCS
ncbi:threonine dehydratase [Xylona heveae TC161]|uniref:Threonine dehydratase n=1 Tax=Xylona heveae (strain CBS 132557 / TC161) TaxID=1328760 RepID=A0A165IFI1_XYLHT|nr:threonine dehydratase [Xylona heveae TC161]KZF24824.1 threonine dehydratase [Xylona heveae TC161]